MGRGPLADRHREQNGTFILNVPGRPDGTIDSKEIAVLDGITAWMQTNGEAIYETRPWKVYGEGPNSVKAGSFQGESMSKLGEKDIRFTRNKANTRDLRTACWAGRQNRSPCSLWDFQPQQSPEKLPSVELLGTDQKVSWKQQCDALKVELPKLYKQTVDYAAVLKLTLA